MTPPDTRYLDREGAGLAYQVFGTGPGEFVYYGSEIMHLDLLWADPHTEANMSAAARNVARRPEARRARPRSRSSASACSSSVAGATTLPGRSAAYQSMTARLAWCTTSGRRSDACSRTA